MARKVFVREISNFFSRTKRGARVISRDFARVIVLAIAILASLLASCGKTRESASQADARPAADRAEGLSADPLARQVDAIVREIRDVLPGLPSQGVAPPSWPNVPARASQARVTLIGEGRLIRASGSEGLPAALHFEVFLDDGEPPRGHLLMQSEGRPPETAAIVTAAGTGRRDGDFSYMFRVADPGNRLLYFALTGVGYGTGALRFRAFEGYLIYPGQGGTLAARPPLYAVDFGYHWPLPPRHEVRLESLRRDSRRLDEQQAELKLLQEQAQELARREDALRASAVPAHQEARRQTDLAELAARRKDAAQSRRVLAAAMAATLEGLYRLRVEIAEEWGAFRESNPYRWMSEKERHGSAAAIEGANALRAAWRKTHEAIVLEAITQEPTPPSSGSGGGEQGDSALPSLAAAREAMERALLRELENKP